MKTIALISLVILAGLLLAPTSQAAPSCCASKQEQAGVFSSAPVGQAFSMPNGNFRQGARNAATFPVAARNAYIPPMPQTARRAAPEPRNAKLSQTSPAYYPVPVAPIQTISVMPPITPVAAVSGPCGCGARFRAANYPAPSGSCCSGRGLNVPRQAVMPSGSVPSCCAGRLKPAAPVSSCCAGKVKAAAPVPSCCAVGPKTARPAPQLTRGARKAPYSYSSLQALPAAIPAGFQSNVTSAMKVPASAVPVLRLGSLW